MPGPTGGCGEWDSDALGWNNGAAVSGIAATALDGITESGCKRRAADSIINNVWAALPHRLLSIDGGIV